MELGVYTFFVCQVTTGLVVAELPLSNVSAQRHLQLGTFNAELALTLPDHVAGIAHPTEAQRFAAALPMLKEFREYTSPGKYSIVVDRDGEALGEWIIWQALGGNPMRLQGNEFGSVLDHRNLGTKKFTNVDQIEIATSMMQAGFQAVAGGITIDGYSAPASGVLRTQSYDAADSASVLSRLTDLANVAGGFDWTIDSQWSVSGSGVRRIARTVRFGHPRLGVVRDIVLDKASPGSPGGNVMSFSVDRDGTALASQVQVYGGGDGASKLVGTAASSALTAKGYPFLTTSQSATTVNRQADLNAAARSALHVAQASDSVPTVTIRSDADPVIGTYGLGDGVSLDIEPCLEYPFGYRNDVRILGWTIVPPVNGPDVVTLEVTTLTDDLDANLVGGTPGSKGLAGKIKDVVRRVTDLESVQPVTPAVASTNPTGSTGVGSVPGTGTGGTGGTPSAPGGDKLGFYHTHNDGFLDTALLKQSGGIINVDCRAVFPESGVLFAQGSAFAQQPHLAYFQLGLALMNDDGSVNQSGPTDTMVGGVNPDAPGNSVANYRMMNVMHMFGGSAGKSVTIRMQFRVLSEMYGYGFDGKNTGTVNNMDLVVQQMRPGTPATAVVIPDPPPPPAPTRTEPAPTNVRATAIESGQGLSVEWDAPADTLKVAKYIVYRNGNLSKNRKVAEVDAGELGLYDYGPDDGPNTYTVEYAVIGSDIPSIMSAASAPAEFVDPAKLSAVWEFSVTDGTGGPTLQWGRPHYGPGHLNGIDVYQVVRDDLPYKNFQGDADPVVFVDGDTVAGEQHTYVVIYRARGSSEVSVDSPALKGKRITTPHPAVNVTASGSIAGNTVSWDQPSSASGVSRFTVYGIRGKLVDLDYSGQEIGSWVDTDAPIGVPQSYSVDYLLYGDTVRSDMSAVVQATRPQQAGGSPT